MKIGFWELVVVVIVAFVFIGPDQLPVYAKKIGKMLRELKKYTGAASEEIQKNVVEPLNEIQAPLKEAVAPLTDIKKDIDNSVKDVTKGFTGIGKTSKEEAAKKAAEEEVTDLPKSRWRSCRKRMQPPPPSLPPKRLRPRPKRSPRLPLCRKKPPPHPKLRLRKRPRKLPRQPRQRKPPFKFGYTAPAVVIHQAISPPRGAAK